MDFADDNNVMLPPPIMPPPGISVAQRGQGAISRHGRQNRQPVAAVLDASTTPLLSRIVVQPSTLSSAIILLSTPQEASAAPPESETRCSNVDSFDLSDLSD